MSLDLGVQVPEDDVYHTFRALMKMMDFSVLYDTYKPLGRPKTYTNRLLFMIVIFSRVINVYGVRNIESLCKTDIRFLHMLEGRKAPSHNTINRFFKLNEKVIEELFANLVTLLIELSEIEYEDIFIDGTKIEANANKYTFTWKKTCLKHFPKVKANAVKALMEIKHMYDSISFDEEEITVECLTSIQNFLSIEIAKKGVPFVYGSGRKKHQLQKWIEQIGEYKEKLEMYLNYFQILGDRNSFSKTDKDATFMRMKDDNMVRPALLDIYLKGKVFLGLSKS